MGMTYTKPEDVRYVDMCITIDKIMAAWDKDKNPLTLEQEDLIYKYLYHLYYNTACRNRYFKKFEDYDEYAIWCAGKALTRLIDDRQLTDELTKIKSILNYIKATSYAWKLKWQTETFQVIWSDETTKGFDAVLFREGYQNMIKNSHREDLIKEVTEIFDAVPIELKNIISEAPYANDKLFCKHLYESVLITFIKELLNKDKCSDLNKYAYKYLNKIELYKLDGKYSNIVALTLNKLKARVADLVKGALQKFDLLIDAGISLQQFSTEYIANREDD